jgi:tRNA-specific 2-thiouridylase
MSGGVDSATAALLLKSQGWDVLGVFMRNWEETGENGVCAAEEDAAAARKACDHIGIPFYAVNFARQYMERVFAYFLDEYRAGRTPNPDVMCNREIKFKELLDFARKMDADYLATGHYAIIRERGDELDLCKGGDPGKDQTYFLYALGQHQLRRILFPVGEMRKSEVRRLAAEAGLPNAARKDSTGICFIGERNFRRFLGQYLPAKPGPIRTADGRVIGEHEGLMYYTLGQRKGIGIGGSGTEGPWFVAGKDVETNTLTVVQGRDHPLLYSSACRVKDLCWVSGRPPGTAFECAAKFRYRQPDQAVRVTLTEEGACRVDFAEAQRAVTPGQSAVFYLGNCCLGGGIIDQAAPEIR